LIFEAKMGGEEKPTLFQRVGSAFFYSVTSIVIVMLNKSVLTTYKFPSTQILGVGQMLAAVIILFSCKKFNLVTFPDFDSSITKKIFPLPLLYLGNLICGLGGTKQLSLPMFTVLRRFSILLTMLLEVYILDKVPSKVIVFSVSLMVGGALVAALNDLAFDLTGYIFIFLNDLFTAANNVYMKKKLNAKELGKYGITFYNSLFMVLPVFLLSWSTGDLVKASNYDGWTDVTFLIQFMFACIMGFILMYSVTVCTGYNSALTTAVVGCLKNIFVTYVGMVFGGDYVFSWLNFIGINISVFGSILYSYYVFKEKQQTPSSITKC